MKYIGKIGLTLLVTLIVSSCNDFLDEKPKKGDGIELETFEQLEALLAKSYKDYERIIIVTESIFSMDGDVAPLDRKDGTHRSNGYIGL